MFIFPPQMYNYYLIYANNQVQLFFLKASFYTSPRDSAEVQGKDARKSDLQVPQMPFYRNTAVLVLVILVDVYPVA